LHSWTCTFVLSSHPQHSLFEVQHISNHAFQHSFRLNPPQRRFCRYVPSPFSLQPCFNSLPAPLQSRQNLCFLTGSTTLPAETLDAANAIASVITCGKSTTIGTTPDVTSGGISFSSINFADKAVTTLSSLNFALTEFATPADPATADLATFQNQLNVYVATEAGIRSTAGSLAIKVPKFFLSFQVARIKTAQGITITDPGQTVEHLLGKVVKNAGGESAATKAKVTALSTQLGARKI
jgi:hypothetical protein